MGYNVGVRLIDDFLAKNRHGRCKNMHETAEAIQSAFKQYINVQPQVGKWNDAQNSFRYQFICTCIWFFLLYTVGGRRLPFWLFTEKTLVFWKKLLFEAVIAGFTFFSIHNYYFLYGLNKDDTGKVVCGPFPKESIIRLRMPATPFVPVIVWIIFCETLNKFRIWLGDKINLLKALFEDEFISLSDWSHCLFILVLLHFWQKQYSPNVCIFLMFFMLFIHHLENLIFWSFAFPSLQVQSSCYDPLLSP